MPYSAYASVLLSVAFTLGCGSKPPAVSADQFTAALIDLEAKTTAIIEAFDRDQPQSADAIVHDIYGVYKQVERGAKALLPPDQLTSLTSALGQHLDAVAILHGPMHEKVFPAGFDFEPVRVELTASLTAIHAALPKAIAAEVQKAQEDREEAAPKASPDEEPPTNAAALLPSAPNRLTASRAPLCPTVMLYDSQSNQAAPERINRIAQWLADAPPDARWVQLVPTLHARINREGRIKAYGRMIDRKGSWESPDNFTEATDDSADLSREVFAAAVRQAVRRGLHLAILPHLDPAVQTDDSIEWRNYYRFRPNENIGIGSYVSLLLDPLVNAIEAEASSTTKIDLAISGEMGRSLFEHPADYLTLVRRLRKRFASNPTTAGVRLGVALNWSGLAGETDRSRIDREAVAALFEELDFIGFSCYAPVSVPPVAEDFARATKNFLKELRELGGVTGKAAIMISEVGIGGGHPVAENGAYTYAKVEQVAAQPYEGSGSPKISPWKNAELAQLRAEFHTALLESLSNTKTNPIEKAFIWSEGPWDPQGVADATFRDESIARRISDHNLKPTP